MNRPKAREKLFLGEQLVHHPDGKWHAVKPRCAGRPQIGTECPLFKWEDAEFRFKVKGCAHKGTVTQLGRGLLTSPVSVRVKSVYAETPF